MDTEKANERVKKTIREAHAALEAVAQIDGERWSKAITLLSERNGKIVLTGVGKSGYIGMKMAATLTSLGHASVFVHPVEAAHGDSGAVQSGDVVIALSFSGNTKELLFFLRHLKKSSEVAIIGITGGETSGLAVLADAVLPVVIREEGCPLNLAPMASTTASLVIGDALAAGLTSPELFTKHDFARYHPSGTLGLSLTPVLERAHVDPNIVVPASAPVSVVLAKMGEIGKGVIAVVDSSGVLMGSITDGDVRRFFVAYGSAEGKTAEDMMHKTPKYLGSESTLKDALVLMEAHKITNIFIRDEVGKPVGIIHIHDILDL